ncbi:hypothetical protein FQV26_10370 [Planococcus sp. CPCC 101016]|uniref:hypothetical protein n=1 Tax=Planococcus sp. CPCC 101016 TaxID=2599617 RepID=UPI0011B81C15|nr:hypothetical protein [Planococcus sp. CPCC 101016]TWT08188.1 hypothetical protein FQV26_10370 [Planococcus sp. CPCC 101016]
MADNRNILRSVPTLREIESAWGEQFELYAQFILNLIQPQYTRTRVHKDNGVDGILYLRESSKKNPPVFYSIYGPEKSTRWPAKLAKIKKDIQSIQNFSENEHLDYSICFVFNFYLGGDEVKSLNRLSKEMGILFIYLFPDTLISRLEANSKQLLKAMAFINGVEQEPNELTDWNNHIFAGKVLEQLINLSNYQDVGDRLRIIASMRAQLLTYLPWQEFHVDTWIQPSRKQVTNLTKSIYKPRNSLFVEHTQVNQGCRTIYVVKRDSNIVNQFSEEEYMKIYEDDLINKPTVFKIGQTMIAVKVENLAIIYRILNICYQRIENIGSFTLYNVLLVIASGFSNSRLYQKEKKQESKSLDN